MNLMLEISMYPFNEGYLTLIRSFIDRINTYADLEISTSATSTNIQGEYQHLMQVLTEMLAWSYKEHGRAVFVAKFIPGYGSE
tara:strand:+ start:2401 stop:2649 length:249 start_codon:yes stop_codon:yes gene_type:complete